VVSLHAVNVSELELDHDWSDERPDVSSRSAFATHWLKGATDSSVAYFELDPGQSIGRHIHSCEETIVVLDGEVEISVADESAVVTSGGMGVAPARAPHNARCVGDGVARCLGFFSSASVVSVYDDLLQPGNTHRSGTPIPDKA
jgi:quercetin dioxygenase-like cupin family protein